MTRSGVMTKAQRETLFISLMEGVSRTLICLAPSEIRLTRLEEGEAILWSGGQEDAEGLRGSLILQGYELRFVVVVFPAEEESVIYGWVIRSAFVPAISIPRSTELWQFGKGIRDHFAAVKTR